MYHILVVDDEPSVSRALKMLLRIDGHEAQCVAEAEAALILLAHRDFDLIVTDCFLGGMRGDALAAIIRQRRPAQPIIMMTAFAPDSKTREALCVDGILEKPFSLLELRHAIQRAMRPKPSPPVAAATDTP